MLGKKLQIDVSTRTMLKIVFIVLSLWFLYLLKDIVLLLFITIIISSAIDPIVDYFENKKIPRIVGVSSIYFLLLVIIVLVISCLVPPVTHQFNDFSQNFPQYYQKMQNSFSSMAGFLKDNNINVDTKNYLKGANSWFSQAPKNIFSTTVGVFSSLVSIVSVLAMAFYMTLVKDGMKNFVAMMTPKKYQAYAIDLTIRIKHQIGRWMQGQLFLILIVFILDYIGLSLVGIPYALILAVAAGFLEVVPYVGPVLASVPGVILGFLISPAKGLFAFLVYFVVQQAEGHIIVPLTMKKAVGLNPVAVILVLLAGVKLGGILGAIIAVPVATAVGLFIKDLLFKENKNFQ